MAVPKRRLSRANTHSRRSAWIAKNPELVTVSVQGQTRRLPRRLVRAARLGLVDFDRK